MARPHIYGVLVWFDEPVHELRATIASVAGFVDTLVALDGAYSTFPHGGQPVSPAEQHEAIEAACREHGIGLYMPAGREWSSQVEKRSTGFAICEELGEMWHDLIFVIDADERIVHLDDAAVLAAMQSADVGTVDVETFDPTGGPRKAPGVQPPSSLDGDRKRYPRLFRLQREMRVGPTFHWTYTATDRRGVRVVLKGPNTLEFPPPLAPTVDLREHLRLTNGTWHRPKTRLRQKGAYAQNRWQLGIDL